MRLPACLAPAHRDSWSMGVAMGRIFTICWSISLSSKSGDAVLVSSVVSGSSSMCLPPATPATIMASDRLCDSAMHPPKISISTMASNNSSSLRFSFSQLRTLRARLIVFLKNMEFLSVKG